MSGCAGCGTSLTPDSRLVGDRPDEPMDPGNVCVCFNCGQVSEFTGDGLEIRPVLGLALVLMLNGDPELAQIRTGILADVHRRRTGSARWN
jgi:hypothetical protein